MACRPVDPRARCEASAASPPTSPELDFRSPTIPCSIAPRMTTKRTMQCAPNILYRAPLIERLRFQRQLRQGFALRFGIGNRGKQ